MMIRSPLSYQGSKFKLVKSLRTLIPDGSVLCDVFGGSGTVCLNMLDKFESVMHNDHDVRVSDILHTLGFLGYDEVVHQASALIDEYQLSKTNELGYRRLVRDWNAKHATPDDRKAGGSLALWVISKGSFSSLMRFNKDGEFNYPFGQRALSKTYLKREALKTSIAKLDQIDYLTFDWQTMLTNDGLTYYLDPPYLASGANIYKGDWNRNDEQNFLDRLAKIKSPWYLSNVLSYGKHKNDLLKEFSKHYTVYYLDAHYSLRTGTVGKFSNVEEVVITNKG